MRMINAAVRGEHKQTAVTVASVVQYVSLASCQSKTSTRMSVERCWSKYRSTITNEMQHTSAVTMQRVRSAPVSSLRKQLVG